MEYVDLHSHSTASDGTFAPEAVVRLAADCGLAGLALTDHDTIAGIAAAAAEAARLGMDFIPGIEISAAYPDPGTLHILGYGINPASPVLRDMTETLLQGRDDRNPKIIAKLQELGVAITMEEVEAQAAMGSPTGTAAPGQVIGRPHIAAVLVRKGYVSSIKEAFNKYLAPGGLAFFDKERLSPERAIGMIRKSGGVPVLAHAVQLRTTNDAQFDRAVKDLIDLGLGGIEVVHSDHDAGWVEKTSRLAERYHLLKTGGSDFHGTNKKDISLGTANGRKVPREWMEKLKEAVANTHLI